MKITGLCFLLTAILLSCATAEERLTPVRTVEEVRLDDIEASLEDPVKTIHLIGMYKNLYISGEEELPEPLKAFWDRAEAGLREAAAQAAAEKRWEDAASYGRSLAALGLEQENPETQSRYLLTQAEDSLAAGSNLAAFLYAYHADQYSRISAGAAAPFLERAAALQQRGTAAFFLGIIDREGGAVDASLRAFAEGRDSPADMIDGVATVMVYRGTKIERGMGSPNWVLGSGFFVDNSGLLITNYHVIESEVDPKYEGFSRAYIRLGDSSSPRIPVKVVGWDKTMDLALLKAEITPSYVFSVVDRVQAKVGETVLAIGSPGGLEKTVTAGIVSATGRRFLQIGDVVQIDAAVNHGNSGGPVIDQQGRLLGIVFAGVEQFQGLNFAVPSERLAAALPAMLRGGKAERPWLGLSLSEVSGNAEVVYVAPFTPAAEQRLPEGMRIKTINHKSVTAKEGALITALQDILFPAKPGELVTIESADGKRYLLRTAARPAIPLAEAIKADTKERVAAALFGLVLAPNPGRSQPPTYLVRRVIRGSVADEAGLSEQDPVSIRNLQIEEKVGIALLEIQVKRRRQGYFDTVMRLPAALDSPDTL